MLKKATQKLLALIEADCKDRISMHHTLQFMDEQVQLFLKERNFIYKDVHHELMPSADVRLADIKAKLSQQEIDPTVTLQEQTQKVLSTLSRFLERYHIGFLSDAFINKYGNVEVIIPCLITPRTLSNEYSSQATFEAQLNFLRKEGFTLDKANIRQTALCNTQANIERLTELLETRGARGISIKLHTDCIDSVSFFLRLQDVAKFECEPILIAANTGEYLSDEEVHNVKRACCEILDAIEFMKCTDAEMQNMLCGLIESYFSTICEIYQFYGTSWQNVQARHADERAKNEEIRTLQESINVVNADTIKKTVTQLTEKVNLATLEQCGFYLDTFTVNRYGVILITLRYGCMPYTWDIDEEQAEKNIKSQFSCTEGTLKDEDLFIQMNATNITSLERILAEIIPTINVRNVNADKKHGFVIKEVSGNIDNLAAVLQKYAEKEGQL